MIWFQASLSVRGVKAVDKLLKTLSDDLQRKGAMKGCRAGAKVVEAEVRRSAPVKTGLLREAFKVRALTKKQKLFSRGVGYSVSNKKNHLFKGEHFYAGFLEYGTKHRFIKKRHFDQSSDKWRWKIVNRRWKYRGRIQKGKFDFLRKSLYSKETEVRRAYIKEVQRFIRKIKAKAEA